MDGVVWLAIGLRCRKDSSRFPQTCIETERSGVVQPGLCCHTRERKTAIGVWHLRPYWSTSSVGGQIDATVEMGWS